MIFHFQANKTHFRNKGCALGLILKVRVFGTRKWPIEADVGTKASSSTLCLNAQLNSKEKFLSNPLFVSLRGRRQNGRVRGREKSPFPSLPYPPPFFPFSLFPYPLPLSTPATQAIICALWTPIISYSSFL